MFSPEILTKKVFLKILREHFFSFSSMKYESFDKTIRTKVVAENVGNLLVQFTASYDILKKFLWQENEKFVDFLKK